MPDIGGFDPHLPYRTVDGRRVEEARIDGSRLTGRVPGSGVRHQWSLDGVHRGGFRHLNLANVGARALRADVVRAAQVVVDNTFVTSSRADLGLPELCLTEREAIEGLMRALESEGRGA